MSMPKHFWRLQPHVCDSMWARVLVRFRAMNAGLGNRDHYYRSASISVQGGWVVSCPLCLVGKNGEVHLLLEYKSLEQERINIKINETQTLQSHLMELKQHYGNPSNTLTAKLFSDEDNRSTLSILIHVIIVIWI